MQEDKQRKKEREAIIKRLHTEDQENLAKKLSEKSGLPYEDYRASYTQPSLLVLIPEEQARKLKIAIAERTSKSITLTTLNPELPEIKEIQEELSEEEGVPINLTITSMASLEHLWSGYEKAPDNTSRIGKTAIHEEVIASIKQKGVTFKNIDTLLKKQSSLSTSDLLETILGGALFFQASDIHFEATDKAVRLRYRVDGVLHDISTIDTDMYTAMLSRLKLISNMKLNVLSIPQNGRFTIAMEDRELEIRAALAPSEYGEDIVLRILDPETINLNLSDLGMRKELLEKIESTINEPNGLILTTGPTGSGKTTSLYAFLKTRNTPDIKIITIEDPIEYHLDGIEQTEINTDQGITFFSSLSSALRRDPDVILVGEIRDSDTARAAIQASLTGHIVFSTLHTNDAAGAIPRLLDLDVQASLIPSALRLIIAQRLIRKLCDECAESYKPDEKLLNAMQAALENLSEKLKPDLTKLELKKQGQNECSACGGLGYKGRIGVFEALIIDETMEQMIASAPSIAAVHTAAKERGMITMKQDAILKLIDGITTTEEIKRILGAIT